MNIKRIFVVIVSLVAFSLLAGKIFQSKFWDSERVEKSVNVEISLGASEVEVKEWLSKSGISYVQIENSNPSFARQTIVKDSGLDAGELSSFIVGNTREGILLGDLYAINIYFFFNTKNRLVKYSFFKIYRGM